MKGAYYNENDVFAAEWLRNLISEGLLPTGHVDERDIRDVKPEDLEDFVQCHFFAGIGGWPLALRMAGWPDDEPVWTGSCPCQPFSAAGRRRGAADERHLWPIWFGLIRECRPATVFGEQVEAAIGLGWLDAVFADLETEGYACGAAVAPACSVGAPHIRQRLWFVAHGISPRLEERQEQPARQECAAAERSGNTGGLGNAECERARRHSTAGVGTQERAAVRAVGDDARPSGAAPWSDLEWLPCIDGKWRPTQPGLRPLAHGVPGRVGKLRAAGNAIVPQAAAEFIRASRLALEDALMFA